MSDLFLTLGYDNYVRFNIHKNGREVDIEVLHRVEKKRALAECKATKSVIGGATVNKFAGVLDHEKRKHEEETVGYFISLSGFTQTALEQEKEVGEKRVILLNGQQVVEELINGRIIVSKEKAMERSGRCAADQSNNLTLNSCELIGHEIGWVWAVFFTTNKQKTHFALIHADGEALAPSIAEKVVEADKSVGGELHLLTYLAPQPSTISIDLVKQAREKYLLYVLKECGEIPLEGLPADQQVGSRRLNLDHIFVPLYLGPPQEKEQSHALDELKIIRARVVLEKRKPVGEVFSKCHRLAILADPGGGKTTLLKRIAIAYAFPERRADVDDKLPDQRWFPLFIRCRQLASLSKSSILDILYLIPNLAEMKELTKPFTHLVSKALQDGELLLLIDGLDEISDEGERIAFIKQLRLFLSIYPTAGIIITSREAGFRIVGGALSAYCEHYRIADFDDDDITRLTLAWHKEVVGDQEKVRLEAIKLAKTICETERVRTLAKNPLLLTTLLLVKRWVGQLPSRRSVLYGKAIEVLLMTWNVEGYKPIEQDEAIPQLAFIASTMMKEGVQRISSRRLKELLTLARKQMPDVLAYARISELEFVKQIELRSSILILSGRVIEQGTLYPVYEFRHLTFQEYLTALAIVHGYYPDRKNGDTILSILKPHIDDDQWQEVIPLVAILAGRNVQPLITYLIDESKKLEKLYFRNKTTAVSLLAQCFLDEVQVAPAILLDGLTWIARRSSGYPKIIRALYNGKYGDVLLQAVQNAYLSFDADFSQLGSALGEITVLQTKWDIKDQSQERNSRVLALLKSEKLIEQAAGALAVMIIAFSYRPDRSHSQREILTIEAKDLTNFDYNDKMFTEFGDSLVPLLYTDKPQLQYAASWALSWLGEGQFWSPKRNPDIIARLFKICKDTDFNDLKYMGSWAISRLPIMPRTLNPFTESNEKTVEIVEQWYKKQEKPFNPERRMKRASLVIGYYLGRPWDDRELTNLVVRAIGKKFSRASWTNGRLILEELGYLPKTVTWKQKKLITI